MIKRRFYKLEHGDRDAPSESSSSSDSEIEAEETEEEEEIEEEEGDEEEEEEEEGEQEGNDSDTKEQDDDVARRTGGNESSSGYESEDSSANEVNPDSSGLPTSDEDVTTLTDTKIASETPLFEKGIAESDNMQNNSAPGEEEIPSDALDYVLKCKSVYKCRLCPRIVCLTVQTLNAHLKSKRHARSVKLLKEGRLKRMLGEDGRLEGEIHPEKDTLIEEQSPPASKRKSKGLKSQHKGNKFNKRQKNK